MRKKKFTEGDWKAVNRGNVYGMGDIFEIQYSDDGECVAEIVHSEHDANLLAASKGLLSALEASTDKLEQVWRNIGSMGAREQVVINTKIISDAYSGTTDRFGVNGPQDKCFGCEHHDSGCRCDPDGMCPTGFDYKVPAKG